MLYAATASVIPMTAEKCMRKPPNSFLRVNSSRLEQQCFLYMILVISLLNSAYFLFPLLTTFFEDERTEFFPPPFPCKIIWWYRVSHCLPLKWLTFIKEHWKSFERKANFLYPTFDVASKGLHLWVCKGKILSLKKLHIIKLEAYK